MSHRAQQARRGEAHNRCWSEVSMADGSYFRSIGSSVLIALACWSAAAQQPSGAQVIAQIDTAAWNRYEQVIGFTDIEHYAVFRGQDETHPVAEMTVKTTYRKGVGKSYEVLNESGSAFIARIGLHPLLDREREINQPGNVEQSWFTSSNYEMQLKPGSVEQVNGRECNVVAVSSRRKAPNLIDGTLWVDAATGIVVRIDGMTSKSPSVFAGNTRLMREYMNLDGFSMSSHARSESESSLIGRTVVTIDYGEYHLQVGPLSK